MLFLTAKMILSPRALSVVHLRNWICDTTSGWHTYTVVLSIWVGGWECGLTAMNRLLLSSTALYSPPSALESSMLTNVTSTAGVYRKAFLLVNNVRFRYNFSDCPRRFPYPLTITLFQQLFTCLLIRATAGLFRKLPKACIPQTGLQPNTARNCPRGYARWLSWDLSKHSESIDPCFNQSIIRQVFPVAVVYTANMTLSTWSFRYQTLIETRCCRKH